MLSWITEFIKACAPQSVNLAKEKGSFPLTVHTPLRMSARLATHGPKYQPAQWTGYPRHFHRITRSTRTRFLFTPAKLQSVHLPERQAVFQTIAPSILEVVLVQSAYQYKSAFFRHFTASARVYHSAISLQPYISLTGGIAFLLGYLIYSRQRKPSAEYHIAHFSVQEGLLIHSL